jgi:hypothetical protein
MGASSCLAALGTDRPTRPPEAHELRLQRWTGRFMVVYEDDRPKSFWFGGISGD